MTAGLWLAILAAFANDPGVSRDVAAVWLGGGFVFASLLSYALCLTGSARQIVRLLAALAGAGLITPRLPWSGVVAGAEPAQR